MACSILLIQCNHVLFKLEFVIMLFIAKNLNFKSNFQANSLFCNHNYKKYVNTEFY